MAEGSWWRSAGFWQSVLASVVAAILFLVASMLWNWLGNMPPLVIAVCFVAVAYYGFAFWTRITGWPGRSSIEALPAVPVAISKAADSDKPAKVDLSSSALLNNIHEIIRTMDAVVKDSNAGMPTPEKRRWRNRALLQVREYKGVLQSPLLNRVAKDHLRNSIAATCEELEFIGSDTLSWQVNQLIQMLADARPKLEKVGKDYASDIGVKWPPDQRLAAS